MAEGDAPGLARSGEAAGAVGEAAGDGDVPGD
jgi:hypothetical protein